jgi:SpoVK/Ycf46/Vps4 family AAA+-type ATPase
MAPSNFVPTINEGAQDYVNVWMGRPEAHNLQQRHDVELIKASKRIEIDAEIRVRVDELMREELKNLKLAIEKDKGKGKKGKKGKKKGKKGKKGKGKKKKGEKDLTPDRTIESLYEELAQEGVIKKYPKTRISDYIGDFSYLATTLRQMPRDPASTDKNAEKIEPMPSLADVRRLITEHCILPLGSQAVHEKAPFIKSVMITGPRGTGKKKLLHAICTETGANLFDLTPSNVAGKYPGKAGLAMLLHLVFKVARAWPPSIVYIGECERTFMKKIPKTDKADPKRFKKPFPKLLKGMKQDDRVMIVGITKSPFDAEVKGLCAMYQRIIMVPRPDYASRVLLWRGIILQYGGHLSDMLDLSSLAKVSDGYTPGHITSAVTQVLSERRVQQLRRKPLNAAEFIPFLSKIDPIYREEEEAFKVIYLKLLYIILHDLHCH